MNSSHKRVLNFFRNPLQSSDKDLRSKSFKEHLEHTYPYKGLTLLEEPFPDKGLKFFEETTLDNGLRIYRNPKKITDF